tara:strand:+ start:24 stop:203 length:180 start_codon:yes stop_codon:yes gene_type:complete
MVRKIRNVVIGLELKCIAWHNPSEHEGKWSKSHRIGAVVAGKLYKSYLNQAEIIEFLAG